MTRGFKKFLVLDTAMSACSAALHCTDTGDSFMRSEILPRGQSEILVPMVQDVLKEAGADFESLDALVTTVGPGTFTGLRIGLSTARSFALALDLPLWGLSTFQALALAYVEKDESSQPFTILVETRRQDFYIQKFDGCGQAVGAPQSSMLDDIISTAVPGELFIGDAIARFQEVAGRRTESFIFAEGYEAPDPGVLARAFADEQKARRFFTENAEPLYLHAPDVSKPKVKPRILQDGALH